MTITVYFGDINIELAEKAVSADPRAFLIDQGNYNDFLNNTSKNITVFTSLGDLPKDFSVVVKILNVADTIIYCPPTRWSGDSIQFYTEFLLSFFDKLKNNVDHFNSLYSTDKYLKLEDQRRSNNPQLWITGCSMSDGVGVDSSQRYGEILSNQLNLPVTFLTHAGSSIAWSADQILRSDIRAGDIVVWGLTSENRFPYWSEDTTVAHLGPSTIEKICPIEKAIAKKLLIDDDNLIYQAVTHVHQVINFCMKIQAKLLIVGLLQSSKLSLILHSNKEFFPYINTLFPFNNIDTGSDNAHPGPKQHQLYADFCQSALKQLDYI